MIGFKDKIGREWSLELSVGLIESIKADALADIDLLLTKPEEFGRLLLLQPKKFAEILWVICKDQAAERSVTPEDFGKLLNRSTIDAATDGFIEAILDFYPRQSAGRVMRNNLPALLEKMDREIQASAEATMKGYLTNMRKVSSDTLTN